MNKVLIVTDSTADLSQAIRIERKIEVLPLYVNFGETIYRDGIDINTTKLYELVNEYGQTPKTSAISPGDFITFFEQYINQGYDIFYTGIGAKISGTFQSALIAKAEFNDRVFIANSDNLSSGIALSVLTACDLRDQGLSAKEIKEKIDQLVPRVHSQFAVRTLDYLHKGGRASGTAKLIGGILRIKPIIKVRNGKLDVYKKPLGKMTRALDIMLDDFFKEYDTNNLELDYVMITHTEAFKQVDYMIDKLKEKKIEPKHLIISEAGCVISSHCGPGTIGILYIVKEGK